MRRPALLTLLLILVASTGRAQDSPEVYLGERMPLAAFGQLPADRLAVPGGEITVAVAPGAQTSATGPPACGCSPSCTGG